MNRFHMAIFLAVIIIFFTTAGVSADGNEKLVTLNYVQADLTYVLTKLAAEMGINIVIDPQVKGHVSAQLDKVPALAALNLVIKMNGYNYKALDGTIVVGTDETLARIPPNLMSIKEDRQVTRVLPLQYADPGDIIKILEKIYPQAQLREDRRLNAVIVSADVDTLDRIITLIYGPAKAPDSIETVP